MTGGVDGTGGPWTGSAEADRRAFLDVLLHEAAELAGDGPHKVCCEALRAVLAVEPLPVASPRLDGLHPSVAYVAGQFAGLLLAREAVEGVLLPARARR